MLSPAKLRALRASGSDSATSIIEREEVIKIMGWRKKNDKGPNIFKVAVVGAGPAGLCAARHLTDKMGFKATVFEQTDTIGGTWVYSDETGKNSRDPLPYSLYKGLRTNLPKESMEFPDFPYKKLPESYLDAKSVLQYLNEYVDHFSLRKAIKLKHLVKSITKTSDGWLVTVLDHKTGKMKEEVFYAVMICNGPNNTPSYPTIEGMETFQGLKMHSKEFRDAAKYKDKLVLVIGLGPSGLDIATLLSNMARKVTLSHNKGSLLDGFEFPPQIVIKGTVEKMDTSKAYFSDGTHDEFDTIIYCTGYTFSYPFLHEDSNIKVDGYVGPLFKHCINIAHPSMCFIGLPKLCPFTYMVDFQVRFFIKTLLGEVRLPSSEAMLVDLKEDIEVRKSHNERKKDYHKLNIDRFSRENRNAKYFADLAKLGQLEPIPPVQLKVFQKAFMEAISNFQNFRNFKYKIIDRENFEVEEVAMSLNQS